MSYLAHGPLQECPFDTADRSSVSRHQGINRDKTPDGDIGPEAGSVYWLSICKS